MDISDDDTDALPQPEKPAFLPGVMKEVADNRVVAPTLVGVISFELRSIPRDPSRSPRL